jgi:hypothetical protein
MKHIVSFCMFVFCLLVVSASAFAGEPIPGQSWADAAMKVLGSIEGQATIAAIVLEFALRLWKSEKPLSILYGISGALKLAGSVLTKAGDVLGKVIPQRLK